MWCQEAPFCLSFLFPHSNNDPALYISMKISHSAIYVHGGCQSIQDFDQTKDQR